MESFFSVLFIMVQNNVTIKVFTKILSHTFGAIDRAVLSSCATKGDHEIRKVTLVVYFDRVGYECEGMGEKLRYRFFFL